MCALLILETKKKWMKFAYNTNLLIFKRSNEDYIKKDFSYDK